MINKKNIILMALSILFLNNLQANLKYNHHSGEYENAHPDSKLKYNHHTRQYTYELPNTKLKYNHHTGEYSYERPDARLKYNPYKKIYYIPK